LRNGARSIGNLKMDFEEESQLEMYKMGKRRDHFKKKGDGGKKLKPGVIIRGRKSRDQAVFRIKGGAEWGNSKGGRRGKNKKKKGTPFSAFSAIGTVR